MTAPRERLPNRRQLETFEIRAGHHIYTASVGFYPDGRIGEVFLSGAKVGTDTDTAVKDAAILLSLGLQHGCPMSAFREAMQRNSHGVAEGPMGVLLDALASGGER